MTAEYTEQDVRDRVSYAELQGYHRGYQQGLADAAVAYAEITAKELADQQWRDYHRRHPLGYAPRREPAVTAEQVLLNLDRVTRTGDNRWQARCPAHEDKSPSLSIAVGDRRPVLLHCHAGCTYEAILDAIGLPR